MPFEWKELLIALCALSVFVSTFPVITGLFQFILVALSYFNTNLSNTRLVLPKISVLIPAWNEGAVIGTTIERLMQLDYPTDRLRVYVVDDASSDETPGVTIEKSKTYQGRVFHIRRVAGGEGKAHTLNYGLKMLWAGGWTEAVLIMDADVIYTRDSILKMARHLGDPTVGSVTAYIKEGSRAPNAVQRFVTFEYITATGASRRAQNVLGFLACLSGGAQLHSRENLLAIGGKIFSHTLAEDTFTTFRTQLHGRRALFEPNAIVYAEEPDCLVGLWKQRVRWGRGNVQITSVFRRMWFNRRAHKTMGSFSMGAIWFSIFLMPIFQISASLSLVCLYFVDAPLAWRLFRILWIAAGVTYIQVTVTSFVVDLESARKSWVEGIFFPGALSMAVIFYSLYPPLIDPVIVWLDPGPALVATTTLFLYSWVAFSMLASYSLKPLEARYPRLAAALLYVFGYGPFLCSVTFGSYMKELLGAEMKWDKTEKTGKVG